MMNDAERVHRDDMADVVRATPKRPKLSTFEQVKQVVETKQCARVGGVLVDGTTASIIVQIHAKLSPENKEKLEALPVRKMADVAWRYATGKGR